MEPDPGTPGSDPDNPARQAPRQATNAAPSPAEPHAPRLDPDIPPQPLPEPAPLSSAPVASVPHSSTPPPRDAPPPDLSYLGRVTDLHHEAVVALNMGRPCPSTLIPRLRERLRARHDVSETLALIGMLSPVDIAKLVEDLLPYTNVIRYCTRARALIAQAPHARMRRVVTPAVHRFLGTGRLFGWAQDADYMD